MTLRSLAAVSIALVWVGCASAQSPAEVRADQALSALTARYHEIWATLSPAARQAFSAQERAWLNRARWDEQKQCVERWIGSDAERSARCQSEVLGRRLQRLQAGPLLDTAAASNS